MKVDNITTGLPAWAKGTIAVVAIGGLAFIGYKIYSLFDELVERKQEKDVVKETEKEILNEIKKGERPTHPLSVYKSAANTIQEKLSGLDRVTDEIDVIKLITKVVKSKLDWLTLVQTFGVRKVDDAFFGSTEYELGNLLKDQLDQNLYNLITTGSLVNLPSNKIVGDGFVYDIPTQGRGKTTMDILNIYLKKIGVTI